MHVTANSNHQNEELEERFLSGQAPKQYQGKEVVIIGGKAHILPADDRQAAALVDKLEVKYPQQIPHLVFVPRPGAYIL